MAYTVHIEEKAAREIRALPKKDQRLVMARITALAGNPRPPGSVNSAARQTCGVFARVFTASSIKCRTRGYW